MAVSVPTLTRLAPGGRESRGRVRPGRINKRAASRVMRMWVYCFEWDSVTCDSLYSRARLRCREEKGHVTSVAKKGALFKMRERTLLCDGQVLQTRYRERALMSSSLLLFFSSQLCADELKRLLSFVRGARGEALVCAGPCFGSSARFAHVMHSPVSSGAFFASCFDSCFNLSIFERVNFKCA